MSYLWSASDAHILCALESDLSSVEELEFKERNKHFWKLGKPYREVKYEIKVLIGAADIRFELCMKVNNPKLRFPIFR
jgi:hypothetical protein